MLDDSTPQNPVENTFDAFISRLNDHSESTRISSTAYRIIKDIDLYLANLEKAHHTLSQLSEKKKLSSKGVEWFLDNYFIIQETGELIQDDLPETYFLKLPALEGSEGLPRIYQIARNMVRFFQVELVRNDIDRTLKAFQNEIQLDMSELWALPLFLRLVLIEILSGTIFDIIADGDPIKKTPPMDFAEIDSDEVIARALRTLIIFDRIDWKDLFESHAVVEKILRTDPGRVYAGMDFETRDLYRKKIEGLAEQSAKNEFEVARIAIDLCQKAEPRTKPRHVGYYLLDRGEEVLKREIGFVYDFRGKLRNFFFAHNTSFFLGGITALTLLVTLGLVLISKPFMTKPWQWIVIGLLSLIPASSVAVNLINSILTAALPPRILPKMDFSKRIPREFRTQVAIPALLTNEEDIAFLLHQLELHYLANKDPNIGFTLLTDYSDAPQEEMPEDETLLNMAINGIEALNDQYQGDRGKRPFFLFHRKRQWNPKEDVWMGWERKRGKLADFNRFLLEGFTDSFDQIYGELEFMKGVRFVITLDSDTIIPRESANALIATLAHPLNQAEFKDGTSEVTAGYTILQPRTEVKPTSVNKSSFTRIFAGDLGLDLYTRAVSDIYQDLFGEGIYVGKGIYDVAAFERSLNNKVPQNTLLSHDLFEGIQGRAGLVSDIVFFEDYPPEYGSQVERLHRWIRGDWQLVRWLRPRVPLQDGATEPNPFKIIDIWKIVDNLRRSLLSPAILLAIITGWLMFERGAGIWTLLLLFSSAFTLIKGIVTALSSRFLLGATANLIANINTAFLRWILWVVFLPYESLIMIDAVMTTLVRVFFSDKRLLQWTTSAHTIRLFGKQRKITTIWQRMINAPIAGLSIGLALWFINRNAFWISLPLLVIWTVSPQIAYWISIPNQFDKRSELSNSERQELRSIARRTWLYFERFIGPDDHWLPPDHFQEDPKGQVAHRTSPTNIGLMLLSTATAYDLGYIGVMDFVYRTIYSFETLDELEKYRGHLLNWYDTQSLKTLSPRYVSTVDSGNYAASLVGLLQTLEAVKRHSVCPDSLFAGVFDELDVICSIIGKIDNNSLEEAVEQLHSHCNRIQKEIIAAPLTDSRLMVLLETIHVSLTQPMEALITEILGKDGMISPEILQDLHNWSDAVYNHLTNLQQQISHLAPWMKTWHERPQCVDRLNSDLLQDILAPWFDDRALSIPLFELPQFCGDSQAHLESWQAEAAADKKGLDFTKDEKRDLENWLVKFIDNLEVSKKNTAEVLTQIDTLKRKIDFYLERMEFDFLFDHQREVFFLGYQVGSGQLDRNHYDLLASEARTASLIAIATNQVTRTHWLHMSRPFTTIRGIPTLISWNGSMFEYLMPNLFNHTYAGTLLQQTSQGAVQAHIDYGAKNKVPWGVSESSYYRFDSADNYQYRGFGVPDLGRKRGLADDLVIAPYASLMAVGVNPRAVLENLRVLIEEGALGHYGFYESIDYTPARVPIGEEKAIVKTYMAHHHGMSLIAIGNFLNKTSIPDRVHMDPRIQSTELLLQEQIPQAGSTQKTEKSEVLIQPQDSLGISITPWQVNPHQAGLSTQILSNGSLQLITTDSGSGHLAWKDVALTRWRRDGTLDPWGIWFYLHDMDQEKVWSIGQQPIRENADEYRVYFTPHMTELRRVQNNIRVNLKTTISPDDDVCLQKITLTNLSNRNRCIRLLSYGEVVLAPQATDRQHPAFNKLFIESEYDAGRRMLVFQRRKRSSTEESRAMAHLVYDNLPGKIEFESRRENFIGRGRDLSDPLATRSIDQLSETVGITLDPIFSLGRRITLRPHEAVTVTYLTLAATDHAEAAAIADRYRDEMKIDNTFLSAESASEKLMRAMNLDGNRMEKFGRLLSRVLYPLAELRTESSVIANNTLGQSGLWPFGISGDYPILLVLINHQDEIESLQEALLAHTYWRKMGILIDLVILNTKDAGYTHELNERIHTAINLLDSSTWVNQRGGIFILTASQMQPDSVRLLKTAASVVISLQTDNLDAHLDKAMVIRSHLPTFMATGSPRKFEVDQKLSRPGDLMLDNGIGGFTSDGREYQIYLEDYPKATKEIGQIPPAPWINVIANEDFGTLVTESGGGYTWAVNSGENRLTPWTNDPVSDPSGEALYLRDEITGEIWSPTPFPAGNGSDYLVKHGQGYTIFESINNGFKGIMKVFVAPDDPVKLVELTLTNLTDQNRRLTATYYAEWVLGVHRDQTQQFIVPQFDNETGTLLAWNAYNSEFSDRVAFLTSNLPVHGLTTDRHEFFGEGGNRKTPESLRRIGFSGRVEAGVDPCAALQVHLNFTPGQEQKILFAIGQGENRENAQRLAEKYSGSDSAQETLQAAVEHWEKIFSSLQVGTPEPHLDLILNRWLPYQGLSCRIWGRSAFYQSSGAYGYRDQLQDVTSMMIAKPEIARQQIFRAARHQFDVGDVLHWWHPPSGNGVRTRITDDLLWLVYVTEEYVRRTGDRAILNEEIPFLRGEPLEEGEEERYGHYETSEETLTLFEHCRRAIERGDTKGPHGLPLIGGGDWNDGMNRVGIEGQGESVWLGWFLVENHNRFASLCDIMGKQDQAQMHRDRAEELAKQIDEVAWEGDRYLRAYYDDGTPLGSRHSDECQIDSLPQSWAVLTGTAPEERQVKGMESVEEHLLQPEAQLIRLFTPPFDKTEQDPGYIKGYPPGVRENGGQYTHAAIWAVWALTELGEGDKAYRWFDILNPVTHSLDLESANRYAVEPYVVAADVYGVPPHTGRGGWTWYTGSSGWLYRLGVEGILGFKTAGEGFTVDPCIPADWEGYQMTYKWKDTSYRIEVQNPNGVQNGVGEVLLDGQACPDGRIPYLDDGDDHEVVVVLGEKT